MGAADGWPRRELKRQAAVAAVKGLAEYQELEASRAAGYEAGAVPGTPDPRDRATSKRRWEKRDDGVAKCAPCVEPLGQAEPLPALGLPLVRACRLGGEEEGTVA